MADREASETPIGSAAGAPDDAILLPELDLAAALGGLDQATRDFSRRLDEAQAVAARAAAAHPAAPVPARTAASADEPPPPPRMPPSTPTSRRPSARPASTWSVRNTARTASSRR